MWNGRKHDELHSSNTKIKRCTTHSIYSVRKFKTVKTVERPLENPMEIWKSSFALVEVIESDLSYLKKLGNWLNQNMPDVRPNTITVDLNHDLKLWVANYVLGNKIPLLWVIDSDSILQEKRTWYQTEILEHLIIDDYLDLISLASTFSRKCDFLVVTPIDMLNFVDIKFASIC